jgi:guanosine-3',5'-bis(diphosphate) 3'-pyrophosphohydrolase
VIARVGGVHTVHVLAAATLHDTVEDTQTTFDELEREFGAEISALVAEVTDDKSLGKEARKLMQIEHVAHASIGAKLIKLGDKICNVLDVTNSPPPDWSNERRLEYLAWSERVVAGCRGTNAALEARFDEVVARGRAELG